MIVLGLFLEESGEENCFYLRNHMNVSFGGFSVLLEDLLKVSDVYCELWHFNWKDRSVDFFKQIDPLSKLFIRYWIK